MFTTKEITHDIAKSFIRKHKLDLFMNKGRERTKFEFVYNDDNLRWFGVFDDNDMVALQVADIKNNDAYLLTIQKIPGIGHGVFESVMNYFSDYTIHFKAYSEKLQKMYKSLGFKQIKNYEFVK